MYVTDKNGRRERAAAELAKKTGRTDAAEVVVRLDEGLGQLCDLVFARIHRDVQREFGVDSLTNPVSELKSELSIQNEVAAFEVVEAAAEVERHHRAGDAKWLTTWLAGLLLGSERAASIVERLASYEGQSSDERRNAFATYLEKTHREATLAPLVMYRLLPLAVAIIAAQAFGDQKRAESLRKLQLTLLPSIADCSACRGGLLAPGVACPTCGNPLWKFALLTAE